MKKIAIGIVLLLCIQTFVSAQGCVAIRSGCGANVSTTAFTGKGDLLVGTNFRFFESYKHFRGTHEETERVEEGTEVINDSYFLDLSVTYGLTDRLSFSLIVPFVYHDRSSMYEHGGNPREDDPTTPENEYWPGDRHTTSSKGLADIRGSLYYTVFNPEKSPKGNLSVGLGVKLRTGDYMATDQFYNQGPDKDQTIESGVDQSIQPSDGGVGITFETQGFYPLSGSTTLTGAFYYMSNPKEMYEIENRGRLREYSVPDQYAIRLGVSYMTKLHGLNLYGGARMEGIPSSDLIGGDRGFRRPGYAISLEPGVSYGLRNVAFNLTVPIAIERNRTQNYNDKQAGTHGDAAFADYLINAGVSWKIGGKKKNLDTIFEGTGS